MAQRVCLVCLYVTLLSPLQIVGEPNVTVTFIKLLSGNVIAPWHWS